MFRFVIVLLIILVLALFDVPFLLRKKSIIVAFTYCLLLFIGISIIYILIQDLPVASPAVYIEKAINFFLKR